MIAAGIKHASTKAPLVEARHLSFKTAENRILFMDLNLSLAEERVALIGRNGVGKSTLLRILSGRNFPDAGEVIIRTDPYVISQTLNPADADAKKALQWFADQQFSNQTLQNEFLAAGLRPLKQLLLDNTLSHGELRKLMLLIGKLSRPSLMLLDEPTQDLDEIGISWLRTWLSDWQGGLLVVSHESELLEDFDNFFIVEESGCHCFSGTFARLESELERKHSAQELRYIRNLNRLVQQEEHTLHIARRRARKKRYGRVSELGRATPRKTLNQKRDYAQVKHGRMKKVREARLGAMRDWAKSTRRSLNVMLPLELSMPNFQSECKDNIIILEDVSAVVESRRLFEKVKLSLGRERLAVVGSNGLGKTTLLQIMLERRAPDSGSVKADPIRIGSIEQGGTDWMLDDSLLECLNSTCLDNSPKALAELLVMHKFPLALAQRPLQSLSPGERVRAALICLFQRSPAVELLVLDEPTYSLDLIGQRALTKALRAWPGGLVVISHNRSFISEIRVDKYLKLSNDGQHCLTFSNPQRDR